MKILVTTCVALLLAGCASAPPSCYEALGIAENPKPLYPASSRRAGEEGTTTLRVLVSASGYPETIDLHESSGFKTLDQAAVETVKNWCFYPARADGKPVSASVRVPIVFRLAPPTLPGNKTEAQGVRKDLQNYERKINDLLNATPRKRFVSAQRAGKYQPYVDACMKKVLEIGNRSYPQEAQGKIYGKVIVTFTISPSGELERLTLDKSSGYKILDDAALAAGRSAAPFDPFPPEMTEEAASLSITTPLTFSPPDAGRSEAQPIIPPDLSRQAAPGR